MVRLIEPDWFDQWFEEMFPENTFSAMSVARRLGVSHHTVPRAVRCGSVEAFKLQDGCSARYVITRPALRKWLLERNVLNLDEN